MSPVGEKFGRSKKALTRVVGEEVLIAVPRDHEVISLTSSGRAIWELLEHPTSISNLTSQLADHYGCTQESIAPDVDLFLNQLLDRGALERHA